MAVAHYRKPIGALHANARFLHEKSRLTKIETGTTRHFYHHQYFDNDAILQEVIGQKAHRNFNRHLSKKKRFYKPVGALTKVLSPVTEIYLAGGGGAGRALPYAIYEASRYGLNLPKVKAVAATSVGCIMGLMITLEIPAYRMRRVLDKMPTRQFQDWSFRSILNIFRNWGVCSGDVMENYFKDVIRETTGLENPTFRQLYKAGYKKEFRVVTANVSTRRLAVFSHKTTPHQRVARSVALACSVPFLFRPRWIENDRGELELYTDGGILKNYPFRQGASKRLRPENTLGIIFVNKEVASAINNRKEKPSLLKSFWRYLCSIFSLFLIQDHLCLPDEVKNRTIAVNVAHNPFNFSATLKEQSALDLGGKWGVRDFIKRLVDNKLEEINASHQPKRIFSSKIKARKHFTPTFELTKNAKKDADRRHVSRPELTRVAKRHSQMLKGR